MASALTPTFRPMESSPVPCRWNARLFIAPSRSGGSGSSSPVAIELDISFDQVVDSLGAFSGIHRRLEIKGEPGGIMIIDDYGHHPAEIAATLAAIRESWSRPLTVVFQPHRFTRTRDLFQDFLPVFDGAERLILTEIYPAGEDPIPGVSADALYQALKR